MQFQSDIFDVCIGYRHVGKKCRKRNRKVYETKICVHSTSEQTSMSAAVRQFMAQYPSVRIVQISSTKLEMTTSH